MKTEDWYQSDINTYQTNDFVFYYTKLQMKSKEWRHALEKVREQFKQAVEGLQSTGVWSNNFNQQPISFGM